MSVSKDSQNIVVQASIPLSKRYLKYLTKKYLKKQDLKEYLRVVAQGKNAYELRYFNIQSEEANEWTVWTAAWIPNVVLTFLTFKNIFSYCDKYCYSLSYQKNYILLNKIRFEIFLNLFYLLIY